MKLKDGKGKCEEAVSVLRSTGEVWRRFSPATAPAPNRVSCTRNVPCEGGDRDITSKEHLEKMASRGHFKEDRGCSVCHSRGGVENKTGRSKCESDRPDWGGGLGRVK